MHVLKHLSSEKTIVYSILFLETKDCFITTETYENANKNALLVKVTKKLKNMLASWNIRANHVSF